MTGMAHNPYYVKLVELTGRELVGGVDPLLVCGVVVDYLPPDGRFAEVGRVKYSDGCVRWLDNEYEMPEHAHTWWFTPPGSTARHPCRYYRNPWHRRTNSCLVVEVTGENH